MRITMGPQFLQYLALARGKVLGVFDHLVVHRSTLTSPLLIAVVAADVRSETPILPNMFCTCVFTVFSERSSAKAISLFDIPPTIIRSTVTSAGVNSSRPACSLSMTAMSGGRYRRPAADRKSTRLNSSHMSISYAVFCLKKKKKKHITDCRYY